MTAIRSRRYLNGSRGEPCKLRISGVCKGDTATVVPCHVRDRHAGRSIKASDISVVDGCFDCHEVFDGRAKNADGFLITNQEWLFYALRGLQETLEARIVAGLVVVPQDVQTPTHARPTRKRKPPAERARILHNPDRKIPSRPLRRAQETTE